jgi:hypothetical protein
MYPGRADMLCPSAIDRFGPEAVIATQQLGSNHTKKKDGRHCGARPFIVAWSASITPR